ncbi:glycosyl hydrolase family 88 [Lachnotalea glycerini]|uniref:Glycosyl hydrolase family 88 n=2 Tax=Lachnotalea glycerini TaxID=1763509 RepID=A0A371JCB6_9FIRM|nr:glycosyl hydrolase family 88 [Lachnotalea glycerini]
MLRFPAACLKIRRKFMKFDHYVEYHLSHFENAKSDWNYEDGCVLMGCVQLYRATGDSMYKDFIIEYMKQFINDDGTINHFEKEKYNIDSIHTGKVLFFLYDETKEEKYKNAIENLMDQLREHPRTKSGNFWHKEIYPNQIWLDGLYMAQPFYMEYETKFENKEHYEDIVNQFKNVRKYIYDEEKGLYYHAFDEAKLQKWADKVTGKSPNFWLRAMGWYLMALIDTMDVMSKEIFEQYKALEGIFKEAVSGMLQYQDKESKLFYQLIDKGDIEGNYLETSGSSMVAYAIIKGCRLGVLSREKYQKVGEEILYSIIDNMLIEENNIPKLSQICSVAGLGPKDERDGSLEYYFSEPIVCDDHKGSGAFMMAYAQLLMLNKA